VKPKHYLLPLTWWKFDELQFPNISFIARQIFEILGFEIEMERIFSIVGVLTSLCRCRLGVDNLDKLVIIMKNWSFMQGQITCVKGSPWTIF
jgi:hypothetical protein